MELGLRGRVAVVGGASRGLGRAVVESLAKEGAQVAICARNAGQLLRTAAEVQSLTGVRVFARTADLTKETEVRRFIRGVIRRFGKIEVLINNCGSPPDALPLEMASSDWKDFFDLLFMSTVHLCAAVVPHMRRQKWGRIINISSASALHPVAEFTGSDAMHAARIVFLKGLATELAKDGILVFSVCAGYIATGFLKKAISRQSRRRGVKVHEIESEWQSQIPLERFGDPQELASVVAFLASERASYITGGSIRVDGGLSTLAF